MIKEKGIMMKKQFSGVALAAVLAVFSAQAASAAELNTGIQGSDINQIGLPYANGNKTAEQLNTTNTQVNRNAHTIADTANALQTQVNEAGKTAAQLGGVNEQVGENARAVTDTKNRLDGKIGNFNDYDGNSRTIEKTVADHDFGIDRAIKQGERNSYSIGKLDARIQRLEASNK